MKNNKVILLFALIVCVLLGMVFWHAPRSRVGPKHSELGSVFVKPLNNRQTTDLPQPRTTPPEWTKESVPTSGQVIIIDPTNQAFAQALAMLEGVYNSTFKQMPIGSQVSPEKLSEVAKLLATARFSQSMHEATIAKVANGPRNSVTIVVPSYEADGSFLKKYVDERLPSEFKTSEIADFLQKDFNYFGKYAQSLEVARDPTIPTTPVYNITHLTAEVGVGTESRLPENMLGQYAAFAGWFPKS